jgi:uncharacterized protein YkwD
MAVSADRRDSSVVTGLRAVRLGIALVVVLGAGLFATTAVATPRAESSVQPLNHAVLEAINAFRVAHHLVPLTLSPRLDRSALAHSLQMGARGYFGHPSANGTAFWRRIAHYYGSRHYGYWSVGENLLWASPDVTAPAAMKMWIASPEHLRNLLTPGWRSIGISAVHVLRAPGVYHGLDVTIITTDFGVRR